MRKSINKIISIFILISIVISNLPLGAINAYVKPSIAVSSPSKTSVNVGDSVSYTVMYSNADSINLSSSYVTLNGFSASVSVSGSGNTRTITLSNIQGTAGSKSIAIKAGSAENEYESALATPNSATFNLNNNVSSNSDRIRPSISVSSPSKTSVKMGESVSYTLYFTDNVGVTRINTSASYIVLNGFTANISVSNSANSSVITLSNIQGTVGNKSISVKAGTASDNAGNSTLQIPSTASFNLVASSSNNQQVVNKDTTKPSVSIGRPNNTTVYKGGSVTYIVNFSDNRGVQKVNLSSSYVTLNGFTANISVSGSGNTRTITLSNIQGAVGNKSISIKAGAVIDISGNSSVATGNSAVFTLANKKTTTTQTKPNNTTSNKTNNSSNTNLNNTSITTTQASTVLDKSMPKITSDCNDNLSVLGDINNKIKSFSTWLSSQKDNATSSIQNNYVAKNEKVSYYVDYYNGSKTEVKNAKITLTIPYNVDVLEINSDGYIKSQTENETVIEWKKDTMQSEAKCRLHVEVKYLENKNLEKSSNISEQFYITLKTEVDAASENSYLRQLFIDKTAAKKASENKYLYSTDSSENIRPDDKLTRAELAKLLVDSNVVKAKQNNTDYTKYKDASEIPTYAQTAISSLYDTGIIDAFSDSEFKPNNPIVRDEFFKIIAKASEYMSNGKLKTKEPTFIYTDIVDDNDKTLSDNTNYIMELIRQNIIDKQDTNPDEYILRKDAIKIINALMFRGPYVNSLSVDTVKFVDVEEGSKYFYDIIGASKTYTYNYTDELKQQILEIK